MKNFRVLIALLITSLFMAGATVKESKQGQSIDFFTNPSGTVTKAGEVAADGELKFNNLNTLSGDMTIDAAGTQIIIKKEAVFQGGTSGIPDATDSISGIVNTGAQTFGGTKTFDGMLVTTPVLSSGVTVFKVVADDDGTPRTMVDVRAGADTFLGNGGAVVIKESGNVGVGADPSHKLHVKTTSGGSVVNVLHLHNDTYDAGSGVGMSFGTHGTETFKHYDITHVADDGKLYFRTGNSSTNIMSMTYSPGDVQIYTSLAVGPDAAGSYKARVKSAGTGTFDNTLWVGSGDASNINDGGSILLGAELNSNDWGLAKISGVNSGNEFGGDLVLFTNAGNGTSESVAFTEHSRFYYNKTANIAGGMITRRHGQINGNVMNDLYATGPTIGISDIACGMLFVSIKSTSVAGRGCSAIAHVCLHTTPASNFGSIMSSAASNGCDPDWEVTNSGTTDGMHTINLNGNYSNSQIRFKPWGDNYEVSWTFMPVAQ